MARKKIESVKPMLYKHTASGILQTVITAENGKSYLLPQTPTFAKLAPEMYHKVLVEVTDKLEGYEVVDATE